MTSAVAIVHDYLTQRGGAERVVLAMADAFPDAPIYTSLFEPAGTFTEFADRNIRASGLNRLSLLRRHHRLGLPLLAPAFSRMSVDAEVAICSSSGWAHGASVRGTKVVYCHTPARWLYQTERYLRRSGWGTRVALRSLAPSLRRWDRRAADSVDIFLANSTSVRERIRQVYGRDAEVLFPPVTFDAEAAREPVPGVEPGYLLCVARLLSHKNVDAVVSAVNSAPDLRLVVAGDGPLRPRLEREMTGQTKLLGTVSEPQLRWLYANCAGVATAAHEDFGLVPLEAAEFGKPTAALRWGGHLDTLIPGETGVFFDDLSPGAIVAAVRHLHAHSWSEARLQAHAAEFSPAAFAGRLRRIVTAAAQGS